MNKRALSVLEFDKIREMLAAFASSEAGRRKCLAIKPKADFSEIDRMQEETAAACTRIFQKGTPSFSNAVPVTESLHRLSVGGALSAPEILRLCKLLENAATAAAYSKAEKEDAPADILSASFASLVTLPKLTADIRRCILSEDEISDDASPQLRSIRRKIKLANEKIHSELTRIITGEAKSYLQDALVTTRDGRYCIPVKSEHKGNVSGVVHDSSASGSTLFIEPASIVKLNNDIRSLEGEEQQEIEAILSGLSASLAEESEAIALDGQLLLSLDYIFARGRLAVEMNATRPLLNEEGVLELKQARHPLLDKKKVVPIDLRLGEAFDLLVITGPNTGGKNVSLKTAGLLVVMGLSGLHIPCADRSRLPLFTEVYADIGDEQSIEQSLSTFSAHMTNIVSILKVADEQSLVLFDELGAGTDPTEGAALAISILEDLHRRGVKTIATTHYSEIKIYALQTAGVENASCEFDVETLSPTYRLLIGIPGKSNAFAIAGKLGLSDELIDSARTHLSEQDESFEDVIRDLDEKRRTLEAEEAEAVRMREEIASLKEEVRKQKDKLETRKNKMLAEASGEAAAILKEAKELADKSIRDLMKQGGSVSKEMEASRAALREKIDALTEAQPSLSAAAAEGERLTEKDVQIGDAVFIISMHLQGTVNTLPDAKGNLYVTCGILRTKVHISDLLRAEAPEEKKVRSGIGSLRMAKSQSATTEINLLGMNVDEACMELDKFLDDAAISHLSEVRIVHGKGTGALRQGVHKYLRRNSHVKKFRLGEYGEGDAGVTIAELK